MNVPLARLDSEKLTKRPARSRAKAPERRREPRISARYEATIESSKGDTENVLLADVSMHGCSIETEAAWIRNGSFISIGLDDQPKLSAIVRWVRDGSAGMEFLRPIPNDRDEWHEMLDMPY